MRSNVALMTVAVTAVSLWSACKPTSGKLATDTSASFSAAACIDAASSDVKAEVCRRWACGRAGLTAAAWKGSLQTCSPDRIDDAARQSALRLVNAYRFLAGLPDVVSESSWEEPAQECALLAQANGKLSHEPPREWSCWSDRAARASGVSLIANRSAPLAIDPFIEDPGNEESMVHRRWLLSESINRIALGSTDGFACAMVDGRQFETEDETAQDAEEQAQMLSTPPRSWVSWPPAGPTPIDAIRRTKIDTMGWTLQSSSLDLDGASVEVRVDGELRPIKVLPLERLLGSLTAIRFLPDGWSTEVGKRYDIHAVKNDIVMDVAVEPVDCP